MLPAPSLRATYARDHRRTWGRPYSHSSRRSEDGANRGCASAAAVDRSSDAGGCRAASAFHTAGMGKRRDAPLSRAAVQITRPARNLHHDGAD